MTTATAQAQANIAVVTLFAESLEFKNR